MPTKLNENAHPLDGTAGEGTVVVGRHRVGRNQSTLVVAEAGVNHDGSVETALTLVDAAVDAGADAVKFQVFEAADLVAVGSPTAGYQRERCGASDQREMLAGLQLSDADFRRIADHCRRRSILFLATPFGVNDVARLESLGVAAIKIASTDVNHDALLARAAQSGLPLIVSTGASTAEEIGRAVLRLKALVQSGRLVLLHCVSCYPTPIEAANLRAIETLSKTFGVPCGLSDHTRSTRMGGWAVAAGACVVEKHFTLDRAAQGPDHAMSLAPDELTEYISQIRTVEQALGSGVLGMTELEGDVRSAARRSVVAATGIRAGTELTSAMLALKRPGTGIAPSELDGVVGRHAAIDIASDTILSWDMVR